MSGDLLKTTSNHLDSLNNETKCVTSVFTVFFEDPFWVGILEENYNGINYEEILKINKKERKQEKIMNKEEKYKKKLEKKSEKKKGH